MKTDTDDTQVTNRTLRPGHHDVFAHFDASPDDVGGYLEVAQEQRRDLEDKVGKINVATVLYTNSHYAIGAKAWQVQGLFAYTVGKKQQNRIPFGYRYKQAEFKDSALSTDYTYTGPIAGFNFHF